MTFTKYPNGVSSFGLPVVGGKHITTGSIFFVDSNTGSNSYDGKDKDHPFSTLVYALTKCTANKGDIIYAMPGHVEDCTSDGYINMTKDGVSIIGIGHGWLRPRITFSAAAASFNIDANDILIQNILFNQSTVDNLTGPIEITGDDVTLLNCEYYGSSNLGLDLAGWAITLPDTSGDRFTLENCRLIVANTSETVGGLVNVGGGEGHKFSNSFLVCPQRSSGGMIHMSSAATEQFNYRFENLVMLNNSSTMAAMIDATSGVTSVGGYIKNVYMGNKDTNEDNVFGVTTPELQTEFFISKLYILDTYDAGESGFLFGSTTVSAT